MEDPMGDMWVAQLWWGNKRNEHELSSVVAGRPDYIPRGRSRGKATPPPRLVG